MKIKKILGIILCMLLVIGVFSGCANNNAEMSSEQIISAVKNSKFENYSERTIGEYLDLYAASSNITLTWSVQTDNVEDLTQTDMTDKEGVVCVYQMDDDLSFFWFFSYDKNSKKVEVIEIDTVGDKSNVITKKSHINQIIGTIVHVADQYDR